MFASKKIRKLEQRIDLLEDLIRSLEGGFFRYSESVGEVFENHRGNIEKINGICEKLVESNNALVSQVEILRDDLKQLIELLCEVGILSKFTPPPDTIH